MLLYPFNRFHYLLATQSPRRQQLFAGMGFEYVHEVREIEEHFPPGLQGAAIASFLSERKAAAFTSESLAPLQVVLTADTIVWQQGELLGKPANEEEAIRMIGKLSGRSHEVFSAVSLKTRHQLHTFVDRAEVYFRQLSLEQITYYVQRFQPMDKAGAYGVQEWIGYVGVEKIIGSFYTVMGLPTQRLFPELEAFLYKELVLDEANKKC